MLHHHITNLLTGDALVTMIGCAVEDDGNHLVEASLEATVADSYIAVFESGVSARARAPQMAADHGLAIGHVYEHALNGFSFRGSAAAVARLASSPEIAYIEADGVMTIIGNPVDMRGKPGGGSSTPQVTPWGIDRVGGPGDGTGKTSWIIDTGIDLDHPDLDVDVGRSVSFARGKKTADDGHGNGTHVAGTVAAVDNDIDVVGVAAGASVVAVRVLDNNGGGTYSDVIEGIDYVAASGQPGDSANLSLGGPYSQSVNDAVINAAKTGISFAIAAGNSGEDAKDSSPASADGNNIYTVSAIGSDDCLTSWSNYGNPPVDYAAPGAEVLSTKKGGGTTTMSGTSMAAPHVAGLLLLGSINTDGHACADPDETPDPIASR